MMTTYNQLYLQSLTDPDGFWAHAAEELHWYKKWDQMLDLEAKPIARWFTGAQINTCYNAVDRHVESGRGEQAAIIYDSPVTGRKRKISYNELLQHVASFAGVLKKHGANKGDRVIKEVVQRVRDQIGPVAAFKMARVVKRLPKTRSGKLLRGTMVKIADGSEWKIPATINNPAILDEITQALHALGYARQSR